MLKNPEATKQRVIEWIRDYFKNSVPNGCAVIGISGGKDSSVAAAFCKEALGADRVIGVTMPDGDQKDISDSYELINHLGIKSMEVNIKDITGAYLNTFSNLPAFQEITGKEGLLGEAKINFPPRIRMSVLYAVAQSLPTGGLVVNTCNRSEDYVGYSTKFGDAAGDFSPMAAFTVEEVRQLGDVLGLPQSLVHKAPSDGLSGMTDEDKLGFTYAELDEYLATGVCENPVSKEKIDRLHVRNLHKLMPMPTYKKSEEE
ncbi:MAG: NAD(+) synthase [Eubacteriales bacterium]|nr:NAD(+) synthase [Eubacteriales bacterium]